MAGSERLAAQPAPEQASIRPRGASARAPATRLQAPPAIDGVLDEPFWSGIQPVTDFVQRDPVDGGLPTERTEVRIAYDDDALYFAMTMLDSEPARIRRSILHREGRIDQDDRVIIALDTFKDRRNGYIFELNPFGTQGDALFTDEVLAGPDWNWEGVYRSQGRITDDGWVLEVAIPFTTIRFRPEDAPEMGIAFYRSIRRKNENVYWPHIPAEYNAGIAQVSQYGTLTGLQGVRPGRNLQVKPFVLAGAQKPDAVASTRRVDDAGVDLKYSITSSLTLDLTYNTDFAQVEVDNVQVNLDRFSLFFPEKREFFLERAGIFAFGAAQETQVFFSRRIGLDNPIVGGGRLTGQVGRVTVGVLDLQTEEAASVPGANNAVARVRADLGPRSSMGAIATNLQNGERHSRTAGADAQIRFGASSSLDVWAARTWSSEPPQASPGAADWGPAGGNAAGAATLGLRNARWVAEGGYTNIGALFAPALGFVQRPDLVRWNGTLAFTPRFDGSAWARQFSALVSGYRIAGQDGVLQSTLGRADARMSFRTGDNANANVARRLERLDAPFRIRAGTEIPPGDYAFTTWSAGGGTNESRRLSGRATVSVGDFYSGTRTTLAGGLTTKLNQHLEVGASVSRNDVALPVPSGDFTTTILGLDVKAAINRSLFANALVQYDDVSKRLQANVRINWIHTPGSNLFLVLDTGYNNGDLEAPALTRWDRRTAVLKVTYLWAL
jgi:hypothetical protein